MPDIHIERTHELGLPKARELAFKWAEAAEAKFDMECTYEEGRSTDLVTFTRSGVNGELKVTGTSFELDARLGFLLGAFRDRIETEIVRNLDDLLAHDDPAAAVDAAVAQAGAKARPAPKGKPSPRSRKA